MLVIAVAGITHDTLREGEETLEELPLGWVLKAGRIPAGGDR